ncbi:methylmalonyl-CoA epimerase [Sutcliffiella horikoshii]|uniref:methylmalonyl-CoA epimerase n=1 Tax=Sutcliffiella horikoshii TaxID=79883 RepID=UPI003CEF8CC3
MRKIRILVAKPGLDGHERGALVIAQALKDAGMDVIYTGLRQSPKQIVSAAIQEDVDVIGLSCLSGAHNELFPQVVSLLKEEDADDILVIGGGVIPYEDVAFLESKGIKKIFTSGAKISEIVTYIDDYFKKENEEPVENVKKVSHIGIAVKSIESSLPFYQCQLGLKLEGIEVVEQEMVKVAFLKVGETRIELLEPTDENTSMDLFIKKRGEGIHHIAFEVDNLEERVNSMRINGINFVYDSNKVGAEETNINFIHPKSSNGVLYELIEKTKN